MYSYGTSTPLPRIEVRLQDETVWLNQAQLSELFAKDKRTISEHIQNIFKEGKLTEDSVIRNFQTTASDGKNYQVIYWHVDNRIIKKISAKSKRRLRKRICRFISTTIELSPLRRPQLLNKLWSS